MFRYLFVAACSFLSLSPAHAQTPQCSNSFDTKNGPDRRFFGLEYAIASHVLAEEYCGADAVAMAPRFLGYIENEGCGPDTEIYRDIEKSIRVLEAGGLKVLAMDGNDRQSLSEDQARMWAQNAVSAFGGCKALIAQHDAAIDTTD